MSKYQIILIVVGIALIGLLYSLPKSIVTNKKQKLENSEGPQPSSTVHANASDSIHTISEEGLSKIKDFQKSFLSAQNNNEKIRYADSLSSVYRRNNRFDSAAYFKELIAELSPQEVNFESAGDMFSKAASFSIDENKVKVFSEKARSYYEKVLTNQPENLDAKSKLAMTYVSTETPMKGITMLREVVEKDPNNEMANFNLGILSIQSKQYDKAAQRFEKLVEINPAHWKARFYLGIAYKESGKNDKAREQFELVKKLEHDPEVINIVDSYLKETGSH
jgi:outer membrane protein